MDPKPPLFWKSALCQHSALKSSSLWCHKEYWDLFHIPTGVSAVQFLSLSNETQTKFFQKKAANRRLNALFCGFYRTRPTDNGRFRHPSVHAAVCRTYRRSSAVWPTAWFHLPGGAWDKHGAANNQQTDNPRSCATSLIETNGWGASPHRKNPSGTKKRGEGRLNCTH